MYAQLADNKVPSGITVIKPDDLAQIWYKPRDLSAYKKVIHIGDIHGCYKPLKEYLEEINPQNYYIFLAITLTGAARMLRSCNYCCSLPH